MRGHVLQEETALAAQLHGWAVVHSAHVSPYGAVPATLVEAPGATALVHVLVVHPDGFEPLDATEPNYVRRRLEGYRGLASRDQCVVPFDL